ncbi:MAG: UvrD-helicase domain-containing protein [Gammaproteobacteria bacterium]|nr:UvrD-helicase domain-containing protein [Gammaproteobacteria bacterium]
MLDAVDAWSGSDEFVLTHLTEEGTRQSVEKLLAKYARETLLDPKNLKQKGPEPELDAFFAVLEPALDGLVRIGATVRARAIRAIRDGVEADKQADRMIAPDDVLRQTARGLTGPHGERFAAHVRSRYPLAFIDEFQDTDPLQYRIFDALYPEERLQEIGALVMIGDPKQAIYAFRGADIHAYLQARAELPEQARVQMAVNWRSSPEMLAAIQTLYEGCGDPFATEDIGFIPVEPRPDAPVGAWRRGGEPAPALTFWHRPADADKGVLSGAAAQKALAAITAAELVRLLDGDTRIGEEALRPGDVTVLVNDRYEAEQVRTALRDAGIASVWQSREPVFATDEAQDLRRILTGALDPRDERAVRAALSTRLLDLSLEQLYRETLADDGLWQLHLDRFGHYHELWRDHGVMVMLRALLTDYRIPPRLLAEPDGARRLTDLRHLGEVLQTRAVELGSMHRLLRFLARQVEEPEADETSQLRLESDGDLVRVATVHGSKGLEYPVVMLPFGIRARPLRDALFHEREADDWHTVLDLMPDEAALARAEQERLAETLRLLYVALTRARHACFVGVANQSEGRSRQSAFHRGALGHLLLDGAGEPVEDERIAGALEALAAASDHIRLQTLVEAEPGRAATTTIDRSMARREPFRGSIERGWSVTSYSALVAGGHATGRDAPLRPGAQDEVHLPAGEEADPAALAAADAAARFPAAPVRGAACTNCSRPGRSRPMPGPAMSDGCWPAGDWKGPMHRPRR